MGAILVSLIIAVICICINIISVIGLSVFADDKRIKEPLGLLGFISVITGSAILWFASYEVTILEIKHDFIKAGVAEIINDDTLVINEKKFNW